MKNRIPFETRYLRDVERGRYRIVTRDGRPAHYVGKDSAGWQVFDICHRLFTYHYSYKYNNPDDGSNDLFLVPVEEIAASLKPQEDNPEQTAVWNQEEDPVDWEGFRRDAAKAAMHGILCSAERFSFKTETELAKMAINCADALIKKLKEG